MIQKSVTFHGVKQSQSSPSSKHQDRKKKKRKSKIRRESVQCLKPSVYQKIQQRRKSQINSSQHIIKGKLKSNSTKSAINNISNLNINIKLDHRRTVFLSLRDFYKSWRCVPPNILFDAILILPLYREWILSPLLYKHEFNDILSDKKFITILQWKDKQGLMFYLLNEINTKSILEHRIKHQHNTTQNQIAPFWYNLSERLQRLYDPDTCDLYRSLILDERWWKYAFSDKTSTNSLYYSKYGVSSLEVLNELYFLTMKFNTIQEILYQSNPSLNVVTTCNAYSISSPHATFSSPVTPFKSTLFANSPMTPQKPQTPQIDAIKLIFGHSDSPKVNSYNHISYSNINYNKLNVNVNCNDVGVGYNNNTNINKDNNTVSTMSCIKEKPFNPRLSVISKGTPCKLAQLDQGEEEDIEIDPEINIEIDQSHIDNMECQYLSCDTLQSPSNSGSSDGDSSSLILSKVTETMVHFGSDTDDEEEDDMDMYLEQHVKNNHNDHDDDHDGDVDDEDDLKETDFIRTMNKELRATKRRSFDSVTSASVDDRQSRKQSMIDNDLEWWVCPDYYYDTYKNKMDTDGDTDY